MAFQFMGNRTQSIAIKGLVVTSCISIILQFTSVLPLTITLPFVMPWVVIWLIGYSMLNKKTE